MGLSGPEEEGGYAGPLLSEGPSALVVSELSGVQAVLRWRTRTCVCLF